MKKNILRVLDANANRAREGLRVCEDICRFVLDAPAETRQLKTLRHRLTAAIGAFGMADLIDARSIETDVGRGSIKPEMKRRDLRDIFLANVQRVKESVRVLEEFAKVVGKKARLSDDFKWIRYGVYALERKIAAQL
jgi:hypothetical protein